MPLIFCGDETTPSSVRQRSPKADFSENITLGAAYESVDLGRAKVFQSTGPLTGTVAGEFDSNYLHVFGVTLIWRL